MHRLPLATALILTLSVGLGTGSLPASGQQVAPAVLSEDVATCLCLEREMPDLQSEMQLRQGILREREGELERLGMDIEVKRAAMAPGDEIAMAELKALIERQLALRGLIRRDIVPSYQDSVADFNASVATYNEICGGKRIEQSDIDRLQGNLQCPRRN